MPQKGRKAPGSPALLNASGVPLPADGQLRVLADLVHRKLLDDISSLVFPDPERLPGEIKLAQKYMVSRPIIRQALGRLRQEGVISSKQGAGSFVIGPVNLSNGSIMPLKTVAQYQRCYEFRLAVEPECAALAAMRASDDAVEDFEAINKHLSDKNTGRDHYSSKADYNFHHRIARSVNNHYFPQMLEAFESQMTSCMRNAEHYLNSNKADLALLINEHGKVIEAIKRRDQKAARTAMRAHISNSIERMFERHIIDPYSQASNCP